MNLFPVRIFAAFALLFLLSCSAYKHLRKRAFVYSANETAQTLQLKVPRRYGELKKFTDSAGSQVQEYRYKDGSLFYIAFNLDTLAQYRYIDTTQHVAKLYPFGGLMYKAIDSTGTFWREVRTDSFRIGYRDVLPANEALFDSAVNYAAARRIR